MRILSKIIGILILLCIWQNIYAKEKLKVAVFEFKPVNVSVYYAAIAKTDVEGWLIGTGDFMVLERTQVDIIFNEMQLKSKGCDTTSCVVEIGKILSSDLVVTGTVQGIAGEKVITVKIINVSNAKIISSNSVRFKDDKELKNVGEKISKSVAKDIQKFDITGKGDNERYEIYFAAGFSYVMPYSSLRYLVGNGYGFNFNVGLKNNNFLFGFDTGFIIFSGRDYTQAKLFPILLNAGYNLNIFSFLSITPVIGVGVTIANYTYKSYSMIIPQDKEKVYFNPQIKTQICLDFSLNAFIKMQIGVNNSIMIEKNRMYPFIDFRLGVIIIF